LHIDRQFISRAQSGEITNERRQKQSHDLQVGSGGGAVVLFPLQTNAFVSDFASLGQLCLQHTV
jgi:hypothetical protein